MDAPRHALAAPAHADPYGWYARLRVSRPLFFDAELGLWVVSGPYLVEQALQDPALRVRPPAEPVPRALLGTAAGEVFSLLLRMRDGEFHARHRPEVEARAAGFDEAAVARAAEEATRDLAPRRAPDSLLSAIPVQAIARLLGVPAHALDRTVDWVHDFTRGIAAGADAQSVLRADAAARGLMEQGEAQGLSRVRAANRIAWMQQALDATAGLLGNAIHRRQADPDAPQDAGELVADVARRDPAVHNTRRFAAAGVELGGERVAAGDALLLVLVGGEGARPLRFGAGPHACPGERIALQAAAAALRTLEALGALQRFGPVRGYRPLPNARIPVFSKEEPA
jgi:cytochrome P450